MINKMDADLESEPVLFGAGSWFFRSPSLETYLAVINGYIFCLFIFIVCFVFSPNKNTLRKIHWILILPFPLFGVGSDLA